MPAFDSVNYSIRPNKAVERKIVFGGLIKLSRIVDLAMHQYIGLGSLWFIDFLMAHKLLEINSMTSIEESPTGYKRCKFNQPLGCIKVIHAESTLAIPDLRLEETPCVVWFDYEKSIAGPAIRDIAMIAPRCAPNSILIVTINAKRDQLPTKDEDDREIDAEQSLRLIAGDLVPTPLPTKRLQRAQYPALLREILSNQFQSATVNSGRAETFIKLFDLAYTDGTPMVTVGGIIAAQDKATAIRTLAESPEWEGVATEPIMVPPLTLKEKITLDLMMPSKDPPTEAQVDEAGFWLESEQIDSYHRYYRYYPIFGEFVV